MAVNCCVVPGAILVLACVTEMDTSTAGVAVNFVEPDIFLNVAVIVVEPVATDVALPLELDALLIVATFADEELQIADAVKFWIVLSE